MSVADVPVHAAEVATWRERLADHRDEPGSGVCRWCGLRACDPWREAARTLWWTDLDQAYEPFATETDRRFKREVSRKSGLPAALKAPLTVAEVAALREELATHAVDRDGLCPFCQVRWCTSWVLAASCLQVNGLDSVFLRCVRATAGAGHVKPPPDPA